MERNTKQKVHKGCSCGMCKAGAKTNAGQATQHYNERKFRNLAKKALREAVKEDLSDLDEVDMRSQISSPYLG